MKRFFLDLKKYWAYMIYTAKAQLKAELANSWLGGLWWVLEPTLFMFVYMFVFTVVFQRTTQYVVAFIVVGLTCWRFFHSCIMGSIGIVKRYRAVIAKVYIPKFVLVGTMMTVSAFKMLCSYIPLVVLMFYYKIPLSLNMLSIIPITLLLFTLTFGLCCLLLHVGVYVEDMNKAMGVILQMMLYISGVFFPLHELLTPELSKMLFAFNPVALILHEARNALLYNIPCQWGLLGVDFAVAAVISVLGVALIYRAESRYIKVV